MLHVKLNAIIKCQVIRPDTLTLQEKGSRKAETMYLIAGLGNPTFQYAKTRHNIGFEAIDELADRNSIRMSENKHKAVCGKGSIGGEKVLLLQPQTYMNNSGESVRAAADFYKIDPERELIVIYDDISLEVGQLRLRAKGSAGGHNGIKSIIAHLGTEQFQRVRIGVGAKPAGWDLADYVLGRFDDADRSLADEGIKNAAKAVECMLTEGIQAAMNQYNVAKRVRS